MFNKTFNLPFIMGIMLGTIMACSSSSWMVCWIGLELNLMSFIPLILNKMSPSYAEASIKYFLAQALASVLIIASAVFINKINQVPSTNQASDLVTISLALKAGMAPVHLWFPQVMELINWNQSCILLTWQKIAPLILLSVSPLNSVIPTTLIISSGMMGMAGGFNQNSLSKIMSYSSIAHLAWMATALTTNEPLWWIYFLVYSALTILLILPLLKNSVIHLNKINNLPSKSLTKKMFFINFLSLAGMPPFLGFIPKLMVVINIMFNFTLKVGIACILIITSLVTLYYYMKLFYSSMMSFNQKTPIKSLHLNTNKIFSKTIMISTTGTMIFLPLVLLI